jgi:hypothetical protein
MTDKKGVDCRATQPMSPFPVATPPPIVDEAQRTSDAVMRAFRLTGDAVRRILSTRKLMLSKKASRRQLKAAVEDFERETAQFHKMLDAQRRLLIRLAKENDAMWGQSEGTPILRRARVAAEDRTDDDALFFTHIREAWNTLRGRHV